MGDVTNFFVEMELRILHKINPDSDILKLKKEVLNLIEKFADSGQSGGSAPFTAQAIGMEIKKRIFNDVLIEINKDPDSLSYEFNEEINILCDKIKYLNLEDQTNDIVDNIKKLFLFEPLSPITGVDEEWGDVREFNDGKTWYQNKRCSAIFKDEKDGKSYYIDAIIKRDQNDVCWSGFAWLNEEDYKTGDTSKMVGKRGYIKSFPFTPKTFYIDVKDVEVAPDDWESFVVDQSQLEEVWKYYDKN